MSIKEHRILVVDDEASFRERLFDMLQINGYVPRAAAHGQAALDIIQTESLSIALIDLQLADMSGLDVLRELRAHAPETECIVLTEPGHTHAVTAALDMGAYGYIEKPFEQAVMLALLRRVIEKVQDRAAQRRSEQRFRLLYERLPIPYQSLDADGYLIEVNDAWLAELGYERDEVIGKWFGDFLAGDSPALFRERFARFKALGSAQGVEFEMKRRDGHTIMVVFDGQIGHDQRGNFLQTHCVFSDVTAQKQAEIALRKNEARLSAFVNAMPDLGFVWNREGRYLEILAGQDVLLYREAHQLLNRTLHEVLPIEVADRLLSAVHRAIDSEKIQVVEYALAVPAGFRWFEARIVAMLDAGHTTDQVIAVVRDITERKYAEEELRASEDKFAKVFLYAPLMMTVSAIEDGTYLDVNEAFLKASGFSRAEVLGKTSVEIGWISPADREDLVNDLRTHGRVIGRELTLTAKNGARVVCLFAGVLINVHERQHLLSIALDITGRKRGEEERQITLEVLNIINTRPDHETMLKDVLACFQRWSGCEAVGIRFRDSDDFPYYETRGFPPRFVELESRLCARDAEGQVVRDAQGNPVLECLCGSVLRGRSDLHKPFFTPGGSFWTNSTSELLATTQQADHQARTRNRCHSAGYESVALIPLRSGTETFGLVQLNDHRPNHFTRERIEQFERIANHVANALAKQQAKIALQESEKRFSHFFENAPLSLWVEDFAQVKRLIDGWRAAGVSDLRAYFDQHPEALRECARAIQIINVNQASLRLFRADSKESLLGSLTERVVDESFVAFKEELVALAEGQAYFESEMVRQPLSGPPIDCLVAVIIAPGSEESWSRVYVSVTDITDRKQIEAAEREQRALAEALRDTMTVINSTLNLEEVFARILTNLEKVILCDAANLALIEDDLARFVCCRGYAERGLEEWLLHLRIPVADRPLWKQSLETRQPCILPETRNCSDWQPEPEDDWIRSFACSPICYGERILGFLNVDSATPNFFTPDLADRLRMFADQAAIAIHNAELYQAEHSQRVLAEISLQIAEMLSGPAQLEATLDWAIERLRLILPYERATVMLVEGDYLRVVSARHSAGEKGRYEILDMHFAYPAYQLFYQSMANGEPVIINDTQQHPLWHNMPAIEADTRSWIGIPLIVWGVVIGFLSLSSEQPYAYASRDVATAKAFAQQLGLAVENSRLHAQLETSMTDLQQAQARLLQVTRLSVAGEVAAGVAHQINNPLTSVIAHAHVLIQTLAPDSPAHHSAEMIKRSAYRAGGVVQRLLDFARPAQYNMQLLDINQSVQSAVSMVRAQVEPHLAHIKLDLTPDLPQVIASEQHLEDIWINLLLNARDAVYGRENSVIEITSRLDYEGTTIAVSIRDNGVGIAPEQLPHVFDPLFTTKTHGTGLGLSICQEIAIRHGGTIEVISQPDWGAEFIVRLPLKR